MDRLTSTRRSVQRRNPRESQELREAGFRSFTVTIRRPSHKNPSIRTSIQRARNTPRTISGTLCQASIQVPVQEMRQTYWNEYVDGSEAENEPYTLYVNPDAEATYLLKQLRISPIMLKHPLRKLNPGFSHHFARGAAIPSWQWSQLPERAFR